MTHPEPQENDNRNPEAEAIARLYESEPDLSGSEADNILADLARFENEESEESEESDGQPDWAQEWHDVDPDG